jgi:hypothetical protein
MLDEAVMATEGARSASLGTVRTVPLGGVLC